MLRSIFAWLALTILVTVLSVALVVRVLMSPGDRLRSGRLKDVENLLAHQLRDTWEDPERRAILVTDLANAVGASLRLEDDQGRVLEERGPACERPDYSLAIQRTGQRLGSIHACFPRPLLHGPVGVGVVLLTAASVLWLAAAILAHKLTRPLFSLIDVTREIGRGRLTSRVRLSRYQQRGELGILADSVNEMAERIERQLDEQRELLAVVSHEIRSPLARLRLSSELLRDNPQNAQALQAIEREVCELDALIGKLLASSRLDFGSIERVPLDPLALARTALERRSLDADLLDARVDGLACRGDPTLVARALDNLLENAERHGHAVLRLVARPAEPKEHKDPEHAVVFEVWDRGPGFEEARLPNVFEAFSRAHARSGPIPPQNGSGSQHVSLGLGLSLVRRIAEAHGGRAWAENLPSAGARVGLSVG